MPERPDKTARARRVSILLGAGICLALALQTRCNDVVTLRGKLVAGREVLPLHAASPGVVTTVYASLGEHVDKGAPLVGLDPNLSTDGLVEQERRLATAQLGTAQLQRTHDMISQLLAAPEQTRALSLKDLGVAGDTFNLINDLYSAQLELDTANEAGRQSSSHQKGQLVSEIALAERNIALLKRNLEASKQAISAREGALQDKRRDFENLGKLAEKGLVSSTDVTHERDGLLQAETAVGDARKQSDQLELDISNRTLHISELKNQGESAQDDAQHKIHAAQVRYDLRLARLRELKNTLQEQIETQRQTPGKSAAKTDSKGTGASDSETRVIHSPVAGIVVRVGYGRTGDRVASGDLLALIQPDGTQPRANLEVSPLDVLRLRPGQLASVDVDAYPARRFGGVNGKVEQVFALPDGNSFEAIVTLDKTTLRVYGIDAPLLPNLTVHAEVTVDRRRLWDVVVGL